MNFHMVWGIGLITASSLLMNDATHSEASESLAGSSHYREERHHCRKDDLRQSNRHSRLKQLSLKAHFHYQVKVPLSLMLIDAVWKRQKKGDFLTSNSRSILFFLFFFFSLFFSDNTQVKSQSLSWISHILPRFSLHCSARNKLPNNIKEIKNRILL